MKKKVLGLLGVGLVFVVGLVVGYAIGEDEATQYMTSMLDDEDEDDLPWEDEEIAQDFDRDEADSRDNNKHIKADDNDE